MLDNFDKTAPITAKPPYIFSTFSLVKTLLLSGKQDFVLTREVLKSVIQHDADLARVFGVEFARGVEVREDAPLPGIAQQAVTDSPNLEVSLFIVVAVQQLSIDSTICKV